ncbi:MAG TPA: DUF2795 domain-containing protein [Candidatus Aquicultor sp.]|jgi:hypothetical protein
MVSTSKISQFLEGIAFPANKQDILSYAQDQGAPQDVLGALRQLPDSKYFSMAGVQEAVCEYCRAA